ncbi:MAG TPA: pyruvate kinase [Lysobacter sp.]|nr:pyruvate kinase [Lysobacter sp.]
MRRIRHAKIVATLGPARLDLATIRALFDAGADVFRLNFSHGTHVQHPVRIGCSKAVTGEWQQLAQTLQRLSHENDRFRHVAECHERLLTGVELDNPKAACRERLVTLHSCRSAGSRERLQGVVQCMSNRRAFPFPPSATLG